VQIEYGLLTDPEGRPAAVRVPEANTAGPAAFTQIAGAAKDTFGLERMVLTGDHGMITTARTEALREPGGKYGRITALRAPAIRKLVAGDGPLQLSLFGEQDLAEITRPISPASAWTPAATRPQRAASAKTCGKLLAPNRRPGRRRQARRRRRDRQEDRRGHRQVQDDQALQSAPPSPKPSPTRPEP